jgi:SAM-dependent methyltransferase
MKNKLNFHGLNKIMTDIQLISAGLKLGDDEIWYSKTKQDISYPADGNKNTFLVEENSFWFKHRNNCITTLVKSYPPEKNGTIFDIGGGNGYVALGLANEGFDVALVEPGKTGVCNAKKRGLKNVICATSQTAKFKPHSLSAIGLFDVIEHIKDDCSFLESMRSILTNGGRLYVTVPSYPFLWSKEDIVAGHFRRYALKDIIKVLEGAGFTIEFSTYIFRFLPLPIFCFRSLPYRMGLSKKSKSSEKTRRDHVARGGAGARLMNIFLHSELVNLANKRSMSFGGSCLLVARNPEKNSKTQ